MPVFWQGAPDACCGRGAGALKFFVYEIVVAVCRVPVYQLSEETRQEEHDAQNDGQQAEVEQRLVGDGR